MEENKNKTEDDFLKSINGIAGGDMNYSAVKDFVCPVMTIPETIIKSTAGVTDGKSAEDFIQERLNRIQELRKKGRKVVLNNNKDKEIPKRSIFKEIMWWCAGADRNLLYMCPADHSKYVGIGTVILFTAIMAMISSWFAFNTIGTNGQGIWGWAFLFAPLWGGMIFFLDRFITNTMYSDGKVTISWLEFRSALPRIIISIFIGIVISTPLELKIFNDKIIYEIELHKGEEKEEFIKKNPNPEIAKYEYEIEHRKQLMEKNDATIKQKEYDKEHPFAPVNSTTTTEDTVTGKTSVKGGGTNTQYMKDVTKRLTDEISDLKDENKTLHNEIVDFQQKIDSAKKNITDDNFHYDKGLIRQIQALHEIAMKDYKDKNTYLQPLSLSDFSPQKYIDYYSVPLILFLIISVLTWLRKELSVRDKIKKTFLFLLGLIILILVYQFVWNDISRLFYFITTPVGLIMMLFIIIDVSPVFYKMMLADGAYDKLLHEEKKIIEDRIRLDLAKELYKLDNSDISKMSAFVFSDTYKKMKGREMEYSKVFDTQENNNKEAVDDLTAENNELREYVIEQKKQVIKAAYAAWCQAMKNAIIKKTKDESSK